ncbi:hypothetical protein [Nocardia sp. NPDC004722]
MMTKGVFASAAACAVLVVAGCGGNDKAAAAKDAPSTPRDQLVLLESEFPAGARTVDIPREKMIASISGMGDMMAQATVTPAECKGPQVDLGSAANDVIGKSSFAVASSEDSASMFVDYVSDEVMDLTKLVDNYAKCPEVRATLTTEGKKFDNTMKQEKLAVPGGLSDIAAVAYRTTSTVNGEAGIFHLTYQGYATLRNRTVGVRVTGIAKDKQPDQATFDTLFTAAVRKVLDAK